MTRSVKCDKCGKKDVRGENTCGWEYLKYGESSFQFCSDCSWKFKQCVDGVLEKAAKEFVGRTKVISEPK